MGKDGVAEGGWMKGAFCMSYIEATDCEEVHSPELCRIL